MGFSGAAKKKINIGGSVTLAGTLYTVTAIADNAFKDQKSVTGVTISSSVEAIGSNAFSGCMKMAKAVIDSTELTAIGTKAFFNCKKLKAITLKTVNLTSVGANAFKGIHKSGAVKVPKSKFNAYKKKFKKVKFKK